jgi:Large polyvalent protein-associated domain 7
MATANGDTPGDRDLGKASTTNGHGSDSNGAATPELGARRARRARTASASEPREKPRATRAAENSIRPSQARGRPDKSENAGRSAGVSAEASAKAQAGDPGQSAPGAAHAGKPEADPWTVPESVRDRFTQVGRRYYFPDGHPAFKDHGRRLTTPSENTEVIRSLIEIAQVRGWHEITVGGTERFRQETWRQAKLSGLDVRGYTPSEGERAALVRSLSRRADASRSENVSAQNSAQDAPSQVNPTGDARSSTVNPRHADALIVGKLLDHGRETYRFDPHQEMSYFIRIETPQGVKAIWGKDLQRAMMKSLTQPQIGDDIAMRRVGADNVTVKRRERDAEGRLVNETDLDTRRNRWVVEKREFFEARAKAANVLNDPGIDPRRAVKDHPELAGTYLNLRAAQIAARALRDPEDQKRFVDLVRTAMADSIARGAPLQPVRLRDRTAKEPRSSRQNPEREQTAVRG